MFYRRCLFLFLLFCGDVFVFGGEWKFSQGLVGKMIAGAFGGSVKATDGEVVSSYDLSGIAVNVSKDELRSGIEGISSSIFFFKYSSKKSADIDMDKFLIGNGEYATIDVSWKDVRDAGGKGIYRRASDEEMADDKKFRRESWSRIYIVESSKPVVATGQMQIEVPTRFDRITLTPGEIGKTHTAGGISATLERCDNDVASVSVTGDFEKSKPVIVFYDETGGRLKTVENFAMKGKREHKLSCRAVGKIARVDVFLAVEYFSGSFEVKATSKPVFHGDDAGKVRAPRYVAGNEKCEFVKMDAARVKRESEVVGRRGYAVWGYNDPRIVLHLPKVDNSCFSKSEITELELYDAAGAKVEHELKGGAFNFEGVYQRFDVWGVGDKDDNTLEYSRSVGKLKIRYPVDLKIVSLTVDEPKSDGLEVRFEDSTVMISGKMELKSRAFTPDRLSVMRGYDGQGRRLKKLEFVGYVTGSDGTMRERDAFWGAVARVDVIVVNEWIELELGFDIAAAKKLPDNKRGIKPVGY